MGARLARLIACALLPVVGCAPRAPIGQPDAPAVPATSDPLEAREARERLVARIASKHPHVSVPVLAAIRAVPRHAFVDAPLERAYCDRPLPIGWGQTISQPSVVAMMTEALDVEPHHRVLEIGTGSGYQAEITTIARRLAESAVRARRATFANSSSTWRATTRGGATRKSVTRYED